MDTLLQNLRVAVRGLVAARNTSAIAVLCLALGIGANTAIFSVVNGVLLRPLPFPESDRLVRVYETLRNGGHGSVSMPNFADWHDQATVFDGLTAWDPTSINLQSNGEPLRLRVAQVSGDAFRMLRVKPLIGRTLLEGEDTPGRSHVTVLSEQLWDSRFGRDPRIIGQTITLDGEAYTVVGVMPASFDFPVNRQTQLWIPFVIDRAAPRGSHFFGVIGRLKPGVTTGMALAQMKQIAARLAQQYPNDQTDRGADVIPLREDTVGSVRPALFVLLGAVGFVLLIACANVANLLLARAASRRKEVAIRSALGASRWRLVSQFLTESVLLALAGGVVGVLIARWGTRALIALAGSSLPRSAEIRFDVGVLAFLLLVCVATGVAFGLAPALNATRADLRNDLGDGGRGGSSGVAQRRVRDALVIAEVALALVLLIGAGLMMRGFLALQRTTPGLVSDRVLTMRVSIPTDKYPDSTAARRFWDPVLERVRAIPGVRTAGIINVLPIQNWGWNDNFQIEGRPELRPADQPFSEVRLVGGDYFGALGIPLKRGRTFSAQDLPTTEHVTLINEALAKRYFANEDPIGKRIKESKDAWTIVGIVGDVRQAGLDRDALPERYLPTSQSLDGFSPRSMSLVVATRVADPTSVTGAVRDAIHAVDPTQPVYSVLTMNDVISQSLTQRELYLSLLGVFASIALVLAVAGIYGVMSYLVTQRTREIGIRMALGAKTRDVLAMVVRQGMGLAGIGIAIGIASALALTRLLGAMLYGVSATDITTFALVATVLALVALCASFIPARRATRVDPVVAIKNE